MNIDDKILLLALIVAIGIFFYSGLIIIIICNNCFMQVIVSIFLLVAVMGIWRAIYA